MGAIRIQDVADVADLLDELEGMLNAIESRAYRKLQARPSNEMHESGAGTEDLVLGTPAARVAHFAGHIEVRVALAGFADDQVTLLAAPGDLVVRAESAKPRPNTGQIRLKAMRRFALDHSVNLRAASAHMDGGVLTIQAPTSSS